MLLFLLVEMNLGALWGLVTVVFVRMRCCRGWFEANDGVANNVKTKPLARILFMGQMVARIPSTLEESRASSIKR